MHEFVVLENAGSLDEDDDYGGVHAFEIRGRVNLSYS